MTDYIYVAVLGIGLLGFASAVRTASLYGTQLTEALDECEDNQDFLAVSFHVLSAIAAVAATLGFVVEMLLTCLGQT